MEIILALIPLLISFAFWLCIAALWTWISKPKGDGTDVLVRMDTHYPAPIERK